MTFHPVLASSTRTQTREGRGEREKKKKRGKGSVYKTRVEFEKKPPVPSIIQSFTPSLCDPGLYSGGGRESVGAGRWWME